MSNSGKSHSDATSADEKSIGFEYQYYYFLLMLLDLRHNESIGLEVKDDVHIELTNGKLALIQLKHSIDASNNVTERGPDLWKTLYNWACVIQDKVEGRVKNEEQIAFCNNTEFILVSNKGVTNRNKLISTIADYQLDLVTYNELREYITKLKDNTDDENIKSYMDKVIKLNASVAQKFWKKVKFEFGCDDILNKIRMRLKERSISESRINDVMITLDGTLRQENYNYIKLRKKVLIPFDEFYKKYTICFAIGQSNKLVIDRGATKIDDASNQLFIKQLIDVEDIEASDVSTILEYSRYKYMAANNLARWLQNGDITELDLQAFDSNSVLKWQNIHKRIHRSIIKALKEGNDMSALINSISDLAKDCLDSIRDVTLHLKEQQLDVDISNGQFYLLSDYPKIGWLYNWESKYANSEQ